MQPGGDSALRTRIYVDGYNLYYGCLKNTLYKWLDVLAVIEHILQTIFYEQSGSELQYRLCTPAVKFFTAPILAAFRRTDDSVSCQVKYHSALRGHLGKSIEIITGYHD